MEVLERSIRSDTIPKALLRVVVGDDGGTGAEFYGATHIPNALFRVVGGVSGGTVAGEPPASRAVGKTERGKSACGLKTETTEQERETSGQLHYA